MQGIHLRARRLSTASAAGSLVDSGNTDAASSYSQLAPQPSCDGMVHVAPRKALRLSSHRLACVTAHPDLLQRRRTATRRRLKRSPARAPIEGGRGGGGGCPGAAAP